MLECVLPSFRLPWDGKLFRLLDSRQQYGAVDDLLLGAALMRDDAHNTRTRNTAHKVQHCSTG